MHFITILIMTFLLRPLYSLLSILNPFRSITFYINYFNRSQSLQKAKYYSKINLKIFLLLLLINLQALHFIYLHFTTTLTANQRLLHFDAATFLQTTDFNLPTGLVVASFSYFQYLMFYKPNTNNTLLTCIALYRNNTFFLRTNSFTTGGRPLWALIRRRLVVVFNLVQYFSFFLICIYTTLISIFTNKLFQNGLFIPNNLWAFYYLGLFTISVTLFCISGLSSAYTTSLVISIGYIQLYILGIKLKQLKEFLKSQVAQQHHFTATTYYYYFYRRQLITIHQYFVQYNALYGQIFLAFLVTNCPISAKIFIVIVYSDMHLLGMICAGAYLVIQVVGLFAIHYYLIGYSRCFRQPSYHMIRLYCGSLYRGEHLRSRLRMAHSIAVFHTKKRYGVTYGRFGLVTMRSFVMFFLIYTKFLMNLFKWSYMF